MMRSTSSALPAWLARWLAGCLLLALLAALLALPEKYRVPLVLYYYGGFSTNEVAALLKIPPATARTRLPRGRAKLKADYLEDDRHEE